MSAALALLIGLLTLNALACIVRIACNSVVWMPGHETTLAPLAPLADRSDG